MVKRTDAFWDKVFERLYSLPSITQDRLAEEFNVSISTLRSRLKKWKKLELENKKKNQLPPIDLREAQKIVDLMLKSAYLQEMMLEEFKKIKSLLEKKEEQESHC
jgi:transposase